MATSGTFRRVVEPPLEALATPICQSGTGMASGLMPPPLWRHAVSEVIENGYYRRNHMVPVPKVGGWEELNAMLLAESKQDEQRVIGDRSLTVGAGMCQEREHLLPLAEEGFDLGRGSFSDGGRKRLREGVD